MSYTIFFDTETGGVQPQHPTIQIAAVVVDDSDWSEVGSFECKIRFDEATADPEALQMNHYDPAVWATQAVSVEEVARRISRFSEPYRSVQMVSKRTGNPYSVSKLAGHNALTFDLPRLRDVYGTQFFPFTYHVKDTLQRALWYFDEHPQLERPESLKLSVLCKYFGVCADGAHDALVDVRMSVALAKAIQQAERQQLTAIARKEESPVGRR